MFNRFTFICITFCLPYVLGQNIIVEPRHIPQPQIFQPIQLTQYDANISIQGNWALTELRMLFFNANPQRLEGTFMLPIPSGAQVDKVTLDINGKPTPAELLDAQKAKTIYEDIVRRMKDPALIEYVGSDLLRARIFPFEANSSRTLTVSYRTLLESDHHFSRYILPIRHNIDVNIQGSLEMTSEIASIESATHTLTTKVESPTRTSFSTRSGEGDFELIYRSQSVATELSAQFHTQDEKSGWVMLRITPPSEMATAQLQAKDVAFVVDSSGSMAGEKLEQAKKALNFCLNSLKKHDRYQIIRFSTEAEPLHDDWVSLNQETRQNGLAFVDGFEAIGGTNIEEALKHVQGLSESSERVQMIFFITDGKPTIGSRDEAHLLSLIQGNKRRFFTLGVGFDVNTHLLDGMSEVSRGARTYVRPEEDIEVKLSHLYRKVQSPAMTELKLETHGLRLTAITPPDLPDLFHGSEIDVLARYTGQGNATIKLVGKLQGKTVSKTVKCDIPKQTTKANYIPKIWAQRRCGWLLDQIRLNGESDEVIQEITQISKAWGVITPYTSYLILEDDAEAVASGRRDAMPNAPAPQRLREMEENYRELKATSGRGSVQASEAAQVLADSRSEMTHKDVGMLGMSTPTRWIAGRMMTEINGVWTQVSGDSIDLKTARKLTFASEAYFKLLAEHPELRSLLALGKVCFWLKDRAYLVEINP